MYDKETVGLFQLAREEGMGVAEASAFAGVSRRTGYNWDAGRLPGLRPPRRPGRISGEEGRTERSGAMGDPTRSLYEPAEEGPLSGKTPDQIENLLLRAVLDDLKGEGSHPGSMSNRRKCELGERLRAATGLPLREITAFLRISRSSYEYHRARLGRDKYAALRREVGDLFRSLGGGRGYRAVHAELRRRGVRVSEKVVRRLMREQGLSARRRRRRAWSSYAGEASPAPPNLPLRPDGTHDFSAPAPNRLWATDITEFRLPSDEKARLLRRQARRLVGRAPADRRPRELEPGGRVRLPRPRRAPRRPLRPRRPLPLARLDRGLPAPRAREEHVAQGQELRQRPDGGLLRPAQERVLPRPGLGRLGRPGLHGGAQRVAAPVPLGAGERGAGLEGAGREPQAARLRGVGCTGKRPQSRAET